MENKFEILVLIILSLSSFMAKADQSQFNAEFGVHELAPDTFVVTDKTFFDSNILVARMPDNTVVIASSPFETQGATELIEWIKAKWNPKKIVAVNTHFHGDGTGGNEAFKKAGVEIWASELTQKIMKTYHPTFEGVPPELLARAKKRKKVLADHTFIAHEGKEFEFGGENVVLIYPGPAHTSDNVAVYLPRRKVLYGTCMIRAAGKSLGYIAEANLKTWATSVSHVSNLGAQIVIPGHGPVGGPELFSYTIGLVEKAR